MTRHPVQTAKGKQWRLGADRPEALIRAVPEETAIGIAYDSEAYAVLMATPQDVEDLAIGFTLSERIARADQVVEVRVGEFAEGLVADVLLTREGALTARDKRRRNIEGRSSCGLCGIQSPEDALRDLPALPGGLAVTRTAIQGALKAMEPLQVLGKETRATHAAAWVDADGTIRLVREDVGRHNALDKVIGAAFRAGLDPAKAFVIVTSRCSYEMVEKAALAGIALLVAVSAPTALAIRKAKQANMTLVAIARADGHTVFSGEERIRDEEPCSPA